MMCLQARSVGVRSIAGLLSEAERLSLEGHLSDCGPCAKAQARLRLFDVLRTTEPAGLSPQARSRVLAHVLAEAEPRRPSLADALARPSTRLLVPIGLAAAALGLALLVVRGYEPTPRPAHRIADAERSGAESRQGPHHTGAALRPPTRVLAFGGARVAPSPDAEVTWSAATETLELRAGSVQVSVPRGGGSIRIETARFAVVALASRFVVTPSTVAVELGIVRVLDPSGRELARVEANERWSARRHAPTRRTCEECGSLLRDARAKLARGRVAEAREIVARVTSLGPPAFQATEAALLLADAARIEGNRGEALRRYLEVARTAHGGAAENALYSAAQLESQSGRADAANRLLREYLDRYPRGRFADEAARRLGASTP